MIVLITGAAGFIGYHLTLHYHNIGQQVIGIDKKKDQLPMINRCRYELLEKAGVHIVEANLTNLDITYKIFAENRPDLVFHLAANADVRSDDAKQYSDNIVMSVNLLNAAREYVVKHFVYASSSAVYGNNTPLPFREDFSITQPLNIYAQSKYAGEVIAELYSNEKIFTMTGLRLSNVYGPWGKPAMAPFAFAEAMATRQPITLYDGGNTTRSWLFIDDAIEFMNLLSNYPPNLGEHRIVNVAGTKLILTRDVLDICAQYWRQDPIIEHIESSTEEMHSNPADISLLQFLTSKTPKIEFHEGIEIFLNWHCHEWHHYRSAKHV